MNRLLTPKATRITIDLPNNPLLITPALIMRIIGGHHRIFGELLDFAATERAFGLQALEFDTHPQAEEMDEQGYPVHGPFPDRELMIGICRNTAFRIESGMFTSFLVLPTSNGMFGRRYAKPVLNILPLFDVTRRHCGACPYMLIRREHSNGVTTSVEWTDNRNDHRWPGDPGSLSQMAEGVARMLQLADGLDLQCLEAHLAA